MGFWPVDAGVGDALAVDERLAWCELLRAGYEIALNHHAHNALLARRHLAGYVVADERLAAIVLAGVGVTEVDHDAGRGPRLFHLSDSVGNTSGSVVHHFAAAAQNDVRVGIAGGDEDGGLAVM